MSKSQNHLFDLPGADLDHIVRLAAADLENLRDKSLFLTGGTGFFGKWLLAGLHHANEELGLNLRVSILSRNPAAFLRRYPEADTVSFNYVGGDIAAFTLGRRPEDFVLHAATDTAVFTNDADERERSRSIIEGTRRVLQLTKNFGARLLNVSSGAVYGPAAANPTGGREDDFASSIAVTPYGIAKHEAEQLCAESNVDFVTARAFAFLGPYLPLDAHFAAGNFLRDALRGEPIIVRGDGTAMRSYLHPADLVVWLLRILLRGQRGRAYNVGSDEAVSTKELAIQISAATQHKPEVVIQTSQRQGLQNIYLPNIDRARSELGLTVAIPLADAIARTLTFLQDRGI